MMDNFKVILHGDLPGLVAQWLRLCTPNAGARVQSLVRELDLTCMPQLRVCMPQLRSLPAATKTLHNEIKKKKSFFMYK